jgi:hypothetical protein
MIMTGATLFALGTALGIGGCGGKPSGSGIASAGGTVATSAPASPAPSANFQEQALAFARCMRAHGVNMADPDLSGNAMKVQIPQGVSKAAVQAAQEACKQYLPNGGQPPSLDPQQVEKLRQFAACMRAHGIPVEDPDTTGGAIRLNGVNPDDPKFKAAQDACRSLNPIGQ